MDNNQLHHSDEKLVKDKSFINKAPISVRYILGAIIIWITLFIAFLFIFQILQKDVEIYGYKFTQGGFETGETLIVVMPLVSFFLCTWLYILLANILRQFIPDIVPDSYIWAFVGFIVSYIIYSQLFSFSLNSVAVANGDQRAFAKTVHVAMKSFIIWGVFYGLLLKSIYNKELEIQNLIIKILIYSCIIMIIVTSLNLFLISDYTKDVGIFRLLFENFAKPFSVLLTTSVTTYLMRLNH